MSKSVDGPPDIGGTQKSPSPPTTVETISTVSSCHMASLGSSVKLGARQRVDDGHCSLSNSREHVRFVEQLDSKGVARLEGRTGDRWSLAESLESADSAVDEKEATSASVVDAEGGPKGISGKINQASGSASGKPESRREAQQ